MLDPILSLAHTIQSSKGTVAFLLGSGVSRAAGIPTGWEVTLDLARRVAAMVGEDPGTDPAEWFERSRGEPPGYSALLDGLARTPAERRAILHSLFEPTEEEREQGLKLPTRAHRAVAELVARGFAKVIVTTNFDRLMETALQDAGVVPTVISSADAVRGAAPLIHQRCVVLKVHGDYLDDRIMNTDAELASYDPAMDAYLDRVFDEFGLVVCGWSGEWDPALRAAIERCPSRRYATYWTGMRDPSAAVAKLIQMRDARSIRIKGADEFLSELRDKVLSLDELASPGPLSIGAAVASVKRFVAEPRHRIRFDDLLSDEVRRARARHAEELPLETPSHDAATIRARFHAYDASMETLDAMLFHASRWASPEHHSSILRAVANLVPPDRAGGTVFLLEMRIYPAVLAFHAACAGALSSGNHLLFRELCSLKLRWDGAVTTSLPELAAYHCIPYATAKHINEKPRYTPMSDHLVGVLRPLLATVTHEPDRAFDRMEVMLALEQLDRGQEPSAKSQLLPGRFSWMHHDSAYEEVFAEAAIAGESWAPLVAGMCRRDADRFIRVREVFMAELAKERHRR